MTKRILIIGGYGTFGKMIARTLSRVPGIELVLAGRSLAKGEAFAKTLEAVHPVRAVAFDIHEDLEPVLASLAPDLVIHTTGPFQGQDYAVAKACLRQRCHYVDLADGRAFVEGFYALDEEAKAKGLSLITGASSVPCLTAALIDAHLAEFSELTELDYGISTAQGAVQGLATAKAVLSYAGKPIPALRRGTLARVFGWMGLHAVRYPELGRRWFANCDIPDLALFPKRYPSLKQIRFCAGQELALLQWATWGLSALVRLRLIDTLTKHARLLMRISQNFDIFGTGCSGLHMILRGKGVSGEALEIRLFMIARQSHGVNIPTIPAILLAKRLAAGQALPVGAQPCLDFIPLDDYLAALASLDITTMCERNPRAFPEKVETGFSSGNAIKQ